MQGVINGYAPYQFGGLELVRMLTPFRPHQFLIGLAMLANERFRFRPRLKIEQATLALSEDLMGRTLWDRSQAYRFNPDARYHYCPRLLRAPFYSSSWKSDRFEKYSIFVGNGSSPLKGAHFAVQALAQLKHQYPQARLYIAGRNPAQLGWRSLNRWVGYPAYLLKLIRHLGLEHDVVFTGPLDAKAVSERLAVSNVFVLPSQIENSPNSLAEAMIMGVPSVASYVGGVPSMARDERDALLYRANDPAMLAYQISRVFDNDDLRSQLSRSSRERAQQVHAPESIPKRIVSVYRDILSQAA
ncbi:MAG: glycosyltransferase [Pseudomonadota bacterium]